MINGLIIKMLKQKLVLNKIPIQIKGGSGIVAARGSAQQAHLWVTKKSLLSAVQENEKSGDLCNLQLLSFLHFLIIIENLKNKHCLLQIFPDIIKISGIEFIYEPNDCQTSNNQHEYNSPVFEEFGRI